MLCTPEDILFNIKMSNTLVNFPQEPVKKPESRKWSWAGDSTKTVGKKQRNLSEQCTWMRWEEEKKIKQLRST